MGLETCRTCETLVDSRIIVGQFTELERAVTRTSMLQSKMWHGSL